MLDNKFFLILSPKHLKSHFFLSCSASLLKHHLSKSFPSLEWLSTENRKLGTLGLKKSNIPERVAETSLTASTSSEESSESSSADIYDPMSLNFLQTAIQTEESPALNRCSLILKRDIQDCPGLSTSWPPTSHELNMGHCEKVVPSSLFNLLAACTNLTTSTELMSNTLLPVDNESNKRKLLSICQDIVSLASNGRKLTPKSLALGLTTRHIVASNHLVRILAGLGHCSSVDSVMRLETGLASCQSEEILPYRCYSRTILCDSEG